MNLKFPHDMLVKKRAFATLLLIGSAFVSGCLFDSGHPEVRQPIYAVQMIPSSGNVRVGNTLTLHATAVDAAQSPIQGHQYVWASSDSSTVLTLPGGVVKGMKLGQATVTATVEGKVGQAQVTVIP